MRRVEDGRTTGRWLSFSALLAADYGPDSEAVVGTGAATTIICVGCCAGGGSAVRTADAAGSRLACWLSQGLPVLLNCREHRRVH